MTAAIYKLLPAHSQACHCLCCVNFEKACVAMPEEWHRPFLLLGINPERASGEVYEGYRLEDGSHLYGGVFQVCGSILDGPSTAIEIEEAVDPTIWFTDRIVLAKEEFQAPLFQVEVSTTMPWVLEEPNP